MAVPASRTSLCLWLPTFELRLEPIILEPDSAHYSAATREILEVLESVSPILQPEEPGVVHIGTNGQERLHGPPHAQVDLVLWSLLM